MKFIEQGDYPVIAVDVVILNEKDEVLLMRRAIEPQKGWWSIVGGTIDVRDNNTEATAFRDTLDKTGIAIKVTHLIDVLANPNSKHPADSRFYVVQVLYAAKVGGGSLRPSKKASELRWLPLNLAMKEKLAFNHNRILEVYKEKKEKNKLIPAARHIFSDYFQKGYTYLQNEYPRLAANAIILNDKKEILLAQRSQWPYVDAWDFPGGHIYVDESITDCLKREVREELGVDCEISDLFHVYSDKGHSPKFADVIAFYFVNIKSQDFIKNIEMCDFKYFSFNNLPEKIAYHNEGALEDIKDFLKV